MLFDLYVVFIFVLYYGLSVNTITILSIFNYLHKFDGRVLYPHSGNKGFYDALDKQWVKYRYHNYGKVDHCCRYQKRICTEINFSFFLIPSLLHTKTCGFYKSRRFFPCFFKPFKLFLTFTCFLCILRLHQIFIRHTIRQLPCIFQDIL